MEETDKLMENSPSSVKKEETSHIPRIKVTRATLCRGRSDSSLKSLRIAVMGAKGVGKTCLIYNLLMMYRQRMSSADYLDKAEIVSGENVVHILKHGNNDIALEESTMFDNSLAESVRIDETIFRARAFILVFDLSDAKTFDNVSKLKDAIQSVRGNEAPMIIVGNKSDKPNVALTAVTDCIVSIDWELTYVETSAELCHNITKLLPSLFQHKILIHCRLPFAQNINRRHSQKDPQKRSPNVRRASEVIQRHRNRCRSYDQSSDFGPRNLKRNVSFWKKEQKKKKTVLNDKTDDEATVSFGATSEERSRSNTAVQGRKKNDRKTSCTKLFTCLEDQEETITHRDVRQVIRYSFRSETTSVDVESSEQTDDYLAGIPTERLDKDDGWGTSTGKGVVKRTELHREKGANRYSLLEILRRYFRRH